MRYELILLSMAATIILLLLTRDAISQRKGDMELWAQTPHCSVYKKLINVRVILVTESENSFSCGVAAQ